MILKMYAYKDTMVEFMGPFCANNDQVARRNFAVVINTPGSELGMIAENMELYQLGTYNTETGETTSEVKYICKGMDVKKV